MIFNQLSFIDPFCRTILANIDHVGCDLQNAFHHKFMAFRSQVKIMAIVYKDNIKSDENKSDFVVEAK